MNGFSKRIYKIPFFSRWKINRQKIVRALELKMESGCKALVDIWLGIVYARSECVISSVLWFNSCMSIFHQYGVSCVCVHITIDKRLEFSSMSLSFLLCSHKQWMENGEKRRRFSVLWSDTILWISIYIIIFSTWQIQFLLQRAPGEAWALVYTNF